MPEDRILAAILFSDIVGYTELMNRDEEKAFKILHKSKVLQKRIIEKYRGNWLKEIGDVVLASFATASEAVACAKEIQLNCLNESDFSLRIGIHLGEVIIENEDVFGDGVNIASRLESLAPDGGIYVSGVVHDNVLNKKGINTTFIKEEKLKNVKEPVRVFEVEVKNGASQNVTPAINQKSGKYRNLLFLALAVIVAIISIWFMLPDRSDPSTEKSIAVRPFWNESAEKENEYFVNGITEDIRNNLAKISGVRVISRGSMEKYRSTNLTTKEIARELDVVYILEGTVQKLDDQVKIHAQLILAEDDDHAWERSFVRDLSKVNEVYEIQSQIAQSVAEELKVIITPEEKLLIEKIPTQNQQAYDLYLRGRDAFFRYYLNRNNADLEHCIQLFQQAISIDDNFALAYAWLGRALEYQIGQKIFIDYEEDTIIRLCDIALSIEPNLEDGYWIRGRYYRNTGQFEKAIHDFEKGLEINQNNSLAYRYLGSTYFFKRDFIEALVNLKKAEKLERGNELTQLYSDIGQLYISIGAGQQAEKYYKESLLLQPNFTEGYRNLVWALFRQGKYEEAYEYAEKLLAIYPESITSYSIMAESLAHLEKYEEAEDYYRKWLLKSDNIGEDALFSRHRFAYLLWMNGKKDEARKQFNRHIDVCKNSISSGGLYGRSLAAYDLAGINAFLGNKEEAYKWLRQYESEGFLYGLHTYISKDQLFRDLWEDDEFKVIIQRQERKFAETRAKIDRLNIET
jgi:class 3 adenylate cyclase/TolB-like protein/Tfp pilus assembly protein PilF